MTSESVCDEQYDISFTNAEELEEQRESEEAIEEETLPLPWDTEEQLRERIFYQFYHLFTPNVQYPTFVARFKNEDENGIDSTTLAEWFDVYSKRCQPIIHDLEATFQRFQNLRRKEEHEKEARKKQQRTELNAEIAKEAALDEQIDEIEQKLRLMRADKQQAARNANKLRRILGEEESRVCNQICTPLAASTVRITRMDATQIDSDLLEFMEPTQKKQKH